MSDHGHFSSYEGHKERRRTGKIRGAFSRMYNNRALDGWMLARAQASSPARGHHHH